MALVPCYECGTTISTLAASCPHCGAPRQQPASEQPVDPGPAVPATQPRDLDHEEHTLFAKGTVEVTTRRFIVGDKTYAMRGITSVEARKVEHVPPRQDNTPNGCGCASLIFGILALGGATQTDGMVFAGLLIALGVVIFIFQYGFAAKSVALPPEFKVRLTSASGESAVYSSRDKDEVYRIVEQLNRAIAAR